MSERTCERKHLEKAAGHSPVVLTCQWMLEPPGGLVTTRVLGPLSEILTQETWGGTLHC